MFYLDSLLAYAYSELTGLQCDDETTEYVCYECAALLRKCQQFRTKCLKANLVISQFIGKYCEITENDLKAINRKLLNLVSTINKHEIKENVFFEFHNESNFDNNKIKKPEQSIIIKVDDVIESTEIEDEEYRIEYLEDDVDVVIVASEINDEVELYDNKNQAVSEKNQSIYLEDDISLVKNPLKDVRKKTEDEGTEVKRKKGQPRTGNRKKANSFMDMDMEYVTIVNLTPEEAKEELLLRMKSDNYQKNPYKCDLCYRGFGTLQTYENHMKKHNKKNGEYNCEYCHTRFSKIYNLRGHTMAYHMRKYCCKLCPHVSSSIDKAKTHIGYKHTGTKYQCDECGQIFSNKFNIPMHKKLKHPTEWVCGLCGSTFGKERGLKLHINVLHKQETNEQKGPLCEECNVHFATETAWKRHLVLSSKHTVSNGSNGCKVCGKIYESEEALKRHATVHAREHVREYTTKYNNKKSIYCTLCKKTLVGRKEYRTHMKTDHSKQVSKAANFDDTGSLEYVCEVCGKMFEIRALLVYHQRVHTGERPYSCAECGKGFKSQAEVKLHLQTHSSSRHQCHMCEKSFVFQNSLKKHINMHRGIRPYKCDICNKYFPTPSQVKYHIQCVHQKVPWPPKRDRSKRNKSACVSSPATS